MVPLSVMVDERGGREGKREEEWGNDEWEQDNKMICKSYRISF